MGKVTKILNLSTVVIVAFFSMTPAILSMQKLQRPTSHSSLSKESRSRTPSPKGQKSITSNAASPKNQILFGVPSPTSAFSLYQIASSSTPLTSPRSSSASEVTPSPASSPPDTPSSVSYASLTTSSPTSTLSEIENFGETENFGYEIADDESSPMLFDSPELFSEATSSSASSPSERSLSGGSDVSSPMFSDSPRLHPNPEPSLTFIDEIDHRIFLSNIIEKIYWNQLNKEKLSQAMTDVYFLAARRKILEQCKTSNVESLERLSRNTINDLYQQLCTLIQEIGHPLEREGKLSSEDSSSEALSFSGIGNKEQLKEMVQNLIGKVQYLTSLNYPLPTWSNDNEDDREAQSATGYSSSTMTQKAEYQMSQSNGSRSLAASLQDLYTKLLELYQKVAPLLYEKGSGENFVPILDLSLVRPWQQNMVKACTICSTGAQFIQLIIYFSIVNKLLSKQGQHRQPSRKVNDLQTLGNPFCGSLFITIPPSRSNSDSGRKNHEVSAEGAGANTRHYSRADRRNQRKKSELKEDNQNTYLEHDELSLAINLWLLTYGTENSSTEEEKSVEENCREEQEMTGADDIPKENIRNKHGIHEIYAAVDRWLAHGNNVILRYVPRAIEAKEQDGTNRVVYPRTSDFFIDGVAFDEYFPENENPGKKTKKQKNALDKKIRNMRKSIRNKMNSQTKNVLVNLSNFCTQDPNSILTPYKDLRNNFKSNVDFVAISKPNFYKLIEARIRVIADELVEGTSNTTEKWWQHESRTVNDCLNQNAYCLKRQRSDEATRPEDPLPFPAMRRSQSTPTTHSERSLRSTSPDSDLSSDTSESAA